MGSAHKLPEAVNPFFSCATGNLAPSPAYIITARVDGALPRPLCRDLDRGPLVESFTRSLWTWFHSQPLTPKGTRHLWPGRHISSSFNTVFQTDFKLQGLMACWKPAVTTHSTSRSKEFLPVGVVSSELYALAGQCLPWFLPLKELESVWSRTVKIN